VANQFANNVIKNMATNLVSTGINSTINGNGLNRDSLANALTNAFITAGLAQGANSIGGGLTGGQLNIFTHQLAHAMLGCAGGVATSGSSDGCAPGAVGAVVGELAAKYAKDVLHWDDEKALNFAKVMSAASGLIVVQDGNDAGAVNLANTMGDNAARYNYLASHKDSRLTYLRNKEETEGLTAAEKADKLALEKEDAESNARLLKACKTGYEPACLAERAKASTAALTYRNMTIYNQLHHQPGYTEIDGLLGITSPEGLEKMRSDAFLRQAYAYRDQQIYDLVKGTLGFLGVDGLSKETLAKIAATVSLVGIVANGKGSGSGLKTPNSQIGAIGSGVDKRLPVPERVTASNGLGYKSNPKHTLGGDGNRGNAGIEPPNSLELFNNSIPAPGNSNKRYAVDSNGHVHQFTYENTGSNNYHWAGSTADTRSPLSLSDIPSPIKREFNLPMKGKLK
jgi:filamentous hemagglutinin